MPSHLATSEPRRTSEAERSRLAHRAATGSARRCESCDQRWPCPTRLRLDEVSEAARLRYAAQVHRAWLAGTPTPREACSDAAPLSRR